MSPFEFGLAFGLLLGLAYGIAKGIGRAFDNIGKRNCPFCAEKISKKANICPHCRSTLGPSNLVAIKGAPSKVPTGIWVVFAIAALAVVSANFTNSNSVKDYTPPSPEEIRAQEAITDAHNKGWAWAQDRKPSSIGDCGELDDADVRFGCDAWVKAFRK